MPILEALVARGGFDFLIVVPTSNEALIAPLKKISDKGIPMITTDTYLGDGDYSKASDISFPLAYIGTRQRAGRLRGRQAPGRADRQRRARST